MATVTAEVSGLREQLTSAEANAEQMRNDKSEMETKVSDGGGARN